MTFSELVLYAAEYARQRPSQRQGQAHFNAVSEMLPDFARRITCTEADPFHNDSRLPQFWTAVAEEVCRVPQA